MGDTVDAIAPGNPMLKLLKSSGSIPAHKSSLDLPGAWPLATGPSSPTLLEQGPAIPTEKKVSE